MIPRKFAPISMVFAAAVIAMISMNGSGNIVIRTLNAELSVLNAFLAGMIFEQVRRASEVKRIT